MDENRETERASLREEERKELCLVQIDIVGHSKIPGGDLTLKKAKRIFRDEIERIAIAHGGERLGWAGDGGSFMFPTRGGEGFNTLVRAALVMLFSMPTINKKIAKETDLKPPLHVRLSCHSGNVAFDQDPTLITGSVLNDFFKNEREISLADTICITERVHEQLDSQLSAYFRLYKYSPEIRHNIYILIENLQVILIENPQVPPAANKRWKTFLIGTALGIVLGIICAAILPHSVWSGSSQKETGNAQAPTMAPSSPSEKEKNSVIIIGSGTVYLYLKEAEENLFDNLRKRKENNIDVQILEGPTLTGAKMFSYAYDQVPILVMASEKLDIDLLRRYREPGKEMPKAVFEAYLGIDPVQILLVAERNEKNAHQDDTSILATAFRDFTGPNLTIDNVIQIFAHRDKQAYDIYAGSKESGTRRTWESLLPKNAPWPSEKEIITWESSSGQETVRTGKPKLFLGSKIQNERAIKSLDSLADFPSGRPFVHKILPIVNESGKPKTRGLYLYGFIEEVRIDRNSRRFYLEKPVAVTLEYVFNLLKNSELLNPDCRTEQIKYFHLGPPVEGWVSENTGKGGVYQIPLPLCPERSE